MKKYTAPDGDTVWATRDGEVFTTEKEARHHEIFLEFEATYKCVPMNIKFIGSEIYAASSAPSRTVTAEVMWRWLKDNSHHIKPLLEALDER